MRLPAGKMIHGGGAACSTSLMNTQEAECEAKKCYDEDDDEEEDNYPIPRHPTPPDGGRSWIVAIAAFVCFIIIDGISITYPVIGEELGDWFNAPHSHFTIVGSVLIGTSLFVGPFASFLCSRYGCRKVSIVGTILATAGFVLSTMSTTVNMMIVTYGVVGGIGLGLVSLPAIVAVGHWFDKKRAFATGFALVGSGVGQFMFPPMTDYLLSIYSWQGVVLIYAGIILNCAICGMFFTRLELWKSSMPHRMPINRKVEIVRGDIMKALIESRKRERTTSQGSLDGCVITRDNKLIKLDPRLFENKRNNSLIARFRRQLGFSSQSLASSKNSLQSATIPSIVIDAVHREILAKKVIGNGGRSPSLTGSPVYRPSAAANMQQQQRGSLPSGNFPLSSGHSNPALLPSTAIPNGNASTASVADAVEQGTVPKTRSCDPIPTNSHCGVSPLVRNCSANALPTLANHQSTEDAASSVGDSNRGMHQTRSASDLQSAAVLRALGQGDLENSDLRIQSIQLIPNGTNFEMAAIKAKALRNRSSRSESSTYSFGGFSYCQPASSTSSLGAGSQGYVAQLQASLEEVELELSSEGNRPSLPAKLWSILMNMFQFRLLCDPMCFVISLSTFLLTMGFYIPYFYLPEKGMKVGLEQHNADFLLSIMGITSTFGRIMAGWLVDRPWVSSLVLYCGAQLVAGLAMMFSPFCMSETSLAWLAAVLGMCLAVSVPLRSILLIEYLGLDQLAASFGILSFFIGVATFVGPPIAGEFLQVTGNIDHCFFFAGALIIVSVLVTAPIKCLQVRSESMEKLAAEVAAERGQLAPIQETLTMEGIQGRESESSTY